MKLVRHKDQSKMKHYKLDAQEVNILSLKGCLIFVKDISKRHSQQTTQTSGKNDG